MIVDALWIGLLVVTAGLELLGRTRGPATVAPSMVAGVLGRVWPGRILLVVVWVFVGWHLFARYTIPR